MVRKVNTGDRGDEVSTGDRVAKVNTGDRGDEVNTGDKVQ
jgi:hypothetical protein